MCHLECCGAGHKGAKQIKNDGQTVSVVQRYNTSRKVLWKRRVSSFSLNMDYGSNILLKFKGIELIRLKVLLIVTAHCYSE